MPDPSPCPPLPLPHVPMSRGSPGQWLQGTPGPLPQTGSVSPGEQEATRTQGRSGPQGGTKPGQARSNLWPLASSSSCLSAAAAGTPFPGSAALLWIGGQQAAHQELALQELAQTEADGPRRLTLAVLQKERRCLVSCDPRAGHGSRSTGPSTGCP